MLTIFLFAFIPPHEGTDVAGTFVYSLYVGKSRAGSSEMYAFRELDEGKNDDHFIHQKKLISIHTMQQ